MGVTLVLRRERKYYRTNLFELFHTSPLDVVTLFSRLPGPPLKVVLLVRTHFGVGGVFEAGNVMKQAQSCCFLDTFRMLVLAVLLAWWQNFAIREDRRSLLS